VLVEWAWRERGLIVAPGAEDRIDGIAEITGLTGADLAHAPTFPLVWNQIAMRLYETPLLVGWNAPFDRAFLQTTIARYWPRSAFHSLPPGLQLGTRWLDVQLLVRGLFPERWRLGYKLAGVAADLGFTLDAAHQADQDALAAGSILLHVMNQFRLPWHDPAWVHGYAQRAAYDYARRAFFRAAKKDPEHVFFPNQADFRAYECDVCHRMKGGLHRISGWTLPEGWSRYEIGGQSLVVCGGACDLVARWHEG